MKYFIITGLLLIALISEGQVKIAGHINDNKNNPLPGVSIVLKNTYDGATSDSLGNYSFTTEEKGRQTMEISIAGYNPTTQTIDIADVEISLNFALKEQVTELKAVVISAGAFEASDKNKGGGANFP